MCAWMWNEEQEEGRGCDYSHENEYTHTLTHKLVVAEMNNIIWYNDYTNKNWAIWTKQTELHIHVLYIVVQYIPKIFCN